MNNCEIPRRDFIRKMGGSALGALTIGFPTRFTQPSAEGTEWGINGPWAANMSRENGRASILLFKEMGCSRVQEAIAWDDIEPKKGKYTQERLNHLYKITDYAASLGMKVTVSSVLRAPSWAPGGGGGGGAYPTAEGEFGCYKNDFANFCANLIRYFPIDTILVGAELTGPQWWLPDGSLEKNVQREARNYRSLYREVKAAIVAERDGVTVSSSGGDDDFGHISGWATEMARNNFKPDAFCPWNYRMKMAPALPFTWSGPEEANIGSPLRANLYEDIIYYQLLLRVPVIIGETGYHHNGLRAGKSLINPDVHASLTCRNIIMAARAKPMAVTLHSAYDIQDSPSGLLEPPPTFRQRSTYAALAELLPNLGEVYEISHKGPDWVAKTTRGVAYWNTDTDYFEYQDIRITP